MGKVIIQNHQGEIAKQRPSIHLIDARGQKLFRDSLPEEWVIREYRPDYGIDYAVEVFSEVQPKSQVPCQTLGEHFFVQLKSCDGCKRGKLTVHQRQNVEKPSAPIKGQKIGSIEILKHCLESSELVTIHRMGSALPLLLVLADVSVNECYFVCINDYIDRILIPQHRAMALRKSRTVNVPATNRLAQDKSSSKALRWYAKRSKFYSAFQRIFYQNTELAYLNDSPEFFPTAKYFADNLLMHDIWDSDLWGLLNHYGNALRRLACGESPGLVQVNTKELARAGGGDPERTRELRDVIVRQEVVQLWNGLTVLARNYEDVAREFFLPTALGAEFNP